MSTEQKPTGATAPATPPVQTVTDAGLLRENEMLKAQIKVREDQLRQAIDIANRANDAQKAKEEAEKSRLIDSIMLDGRFTKEDLSPKTLGELQIMRITLDKALEKTFASVAAEIDEAKHRKQPHFTAGAWDAKKQDWVGGS